MEHLDELLIKQIEPMKKARLFALLFEKTPTYEQLKLGTPGYDVLTGVSPIFRLLKSENSPMVTHVGKTWKTVYNGLIVLDERLKQLGIY